LSLVRCKKRVHYQCIAGCIAPSCQPRKEEVKCEGYPDAGEAGILEMFAALDDWFNDRVTELQDFHGCFFIEKRMLNRIVSVLTELTNVGIEVREEKADYEHRYAEHEHEHEHENENEE
jgi:hypothetical protein